MIPDEEGWYEYRMYCHPSLPWARMLSRPRKLFVENKLGLLFVEGYGPVSAMHPGTWVRLRDGGVV